MRSIERAVSTELIMASRKSKANAAAARRKSRVVAVMATFPARKRFVGEAIASLMRQVDQFYLVANQCNKRELERLVPKGTEVIIPPKDLKDTGKFFVKVEPDDYVILCDDDIIYPPDYVERLQSVYKEFEHLKPIVGVHGVTYSDFFDGNPAGRIVQVFHQVMPGHCFVNQLGTGTLLCRGTQMPEFAFMETSSKFVDVRFAVHSQRKGYPRICIARSGGWMKEIQTGDSLFENFTKTWPAAVTREAQEIAGIRFLPAKADGAPF